jgi:hypothetical protein
LGSAHGDLKVKTLTKHQVVLNRRRRVHLAAAGWEIQDVTVEVVITGAACPSEEEWRRLYAAVRKVWYIRGGPFDDDSGETVEEVLAELQAAQGPRPARGDGLARYWEAILAGARARGITQWSTWRALRQYVVRRERGMRPRSGARLDLEARVQAHEAALRRQGVRFIRSDS